MKDKRTNLEIKIVTFLTYDDILHQNSQISPNLTQSRHLLFPLEKQSYSTNSDTKIWILPRLIYMY